MGAVCCGAARSGEQGQHQPPPHQPPPLTLEGVAVMVARVRRDHELALKDVETRVMRAALAGMRDEADYLRTLLEARLRAAGEASDALRAHVVADLTEALGRAREDSAAMATRLEARVRRDNAALQEQVDRAFASTRRAGSGSGSPSRAGTGTALHGVLRRTSVSFRGLTADPLGASRRGSCHVVRDPDVDAGPAGPGGLGAGDGGGCNCGDDGCEDAPSSREWSGWRHDG